MAQTSGVNILQLHLVVLRSQAGDERAFAQLFDWFGERTLRYLRTLVGDAADDVQQEVWLAVYRGLSSLANPRAFRTWLFRTTRYRAIDYLRKQKREQELADEAVADLSWETEGSADADIGSVDPADLEAALRELPPPHREVLLLRYRDDLSYAECALVVGCSVGTIRSRLHYAKQRMQELIERRKPRYASEDL